MEMLAREALLRCETLARATEEPGKITRTYLTPAMREAHRVVTWWMVEAGMQVRTDAVGNLIGHFPGADAGCPTLLIGSHLDTVKDAGKYDGALGVILAIALVKSLGGRRLPYSIDVIGFGEEEGVRFHVPFLGSHAVAGTLDPAMLNLRDDERISVLDAIRNFGLPPVLLEGCTYPREKLLGYLEMHIEQGPLLEALDLPVGVVSGIAGQSRLRGRFVGKAAHAGSTPMHLRRDAVQCAAAFLMELEETARQIPGLMVTVGKFTALPGSINVVPGEVECSLDVRHADDAIRQMALQALFERSRHIAASRGLTVEWDPLVGQAAVPMDPHLTDVLAGVVAAEGLNVERLVSGAGHDAMIMTKLTKTAMLFIRCKDGLSHHPDEAVSEADVATALKIAAGFLERMAAEVTPQCMT